MTSPTIIWVDPAKLRVSPSRRDGVDPIKFHRQMRQHGTSSTGMPPLTLKRSSDGELVIVDGVTRAYRTARFAPGRLVPAELIVPGFGRAASLPRVEDFL